MHSTECAFSYDGTKLVCNNSTNVSPTDAVGVVDLTQSTLAVTVLDMNGDANSDVGRASSFVANPDGSFWVVSHSRALTKLNADNTFTIIGNDVFRGVTGFITAAAPDKLIMNDYGTLVAVDLATGVPATIAGRSEYTYSHGVCLTPY